MTATNKALVFAFYFPIAGLGRIVKKEGRMGVAAN